MKKFMLFIAVTLTAVLFVTGAPAAGGVKLNAANFPDKVLRERLADWDWDSDGALSDGEIAAITQLTLSNTDVKDLRGLKYLTSLTYLDVGCTEVSTLDLKWVPGLTYLQAASTNISSLDLGQVPELLDLYVSGSNITSLDVKKCPRLRLLSCGYTDIGKLDLSGSGALRYLYCGYTNMTGLKLSACRDLTTLDCSGNKMSTLSLKYNTKLKELRCDSMGLTSLDVSGLTGLTELSCFGNSLTKLDLSKNTKLIELSCQGNSLTALDLSKNKALQDLSCQRNKLAKLDLSANTKLKYLDCSSNGMTKLTLPGSTALITVSCLNNQLAALDVSKCAELDALYCSGNKLTDLDLKNNKKLRTLNCSDNRLTMLDVSACTKLWRLDARNNRLAGIDLTKNTSLTDMDISLSGNKRTLTAEAGRIFFADLKIKSANVSDVTGATKSSTFMTASKSGNVTYKYKVRTGLKVKFTLKVTYKKGELTSVTTAKDSYAYTGKAIKPAVTVKSKISGRTVKLSKGTQYKVYYKNNVSAGTATITVKGTGHFTGTLTKTFKITRVKLASLTLSQTTMSYTGSERKPGVTVKAKVDGVTKILEKGVDYTVKYENNIKKGTATVTVKGIGNFTGTLTKTFTIK